MSVLSKIGEFLRGNPIKPGKTVDASKVMLISEEINMIDFHYGNSAQSSVYNHSNPTTHRFVSVVYHRSPKHGDYTTIYKFGSGHRRGGQMLIHRGHMSVETAKHI